MKRQRIFALALAFGCSSFVLAAPQQEQRDQNRDQGQYQDQNRDQRRDQDQMRNQGQNRDEDRYRRQDQDESAYHNNRYYEQGWKDGLHHKHASRQWDNDTDRQAYEAGYVHGDRGEKWQNPKHHRDNDRHDRNNDHRDNDHR